jgi:hypothetical protein
MSDKTYVRMTVKYINGDEEHYKFKRQMVDETQINDKIREALKSQFLMIELENKIQMIPFNNVALIELSPPPVKLPSTCIIGASLV